MSFEIPSGLVDGINTVFGLASQPSMEQFFIDRLIQKPGVDYTLSGRTIICSPAPVPLSILRCWTTTAYSVRTQPVETADGARSVFTIATPGPVLNEEVYVDRILQEPQVDYVLAGQVLTFQPGSLPPDDAVFDILYRRTLPLANTFTSETPAPSSSLTLAGYPTSDGVRVVVDRLRQMPALDYALSGRGLGFLSGSVPDSSARVRFSYQVANIVVGTQPGQSSTPGALVLPASIGMGKWCNDSEITDAQLAINALLKVVAGLIK